MNEEQNINIKQRIIGALVLVSLGIIIIPMLLNGGATSKHSISGNNIPEQPKKFKAVLPNVPQPMVMPARKTVTAYPDRKQGTIVKPKDAMPKNSSVKKQVAAKPKSKSKPIVDKSNYKKATKPTSTKINTAYTLQIASFSQKANAEALQKKLRKKNYKAYTESILTSKGRIYRLRVGPYLKFDQITSIKIKIEKQFKLKNTIIIKY